MAESWLPDVTTTVVTSDRRAERPLEELDRLDRRHAPVVDVAGHEHRIDRHAVGRVLDELADALEHSRLRLVEVHAVERAPEVPVGGVEQPHASTVGPRADTLPADTPADGRSPTVAHRTVRRHRPSIVGAGPYRDRMVRPRVVVYNEVSIDGRVVGFDTDPSRYYRLGFRWRSDAILMGSTTALAFGPPEPVADQRRTLPPPERLPVVPGFESLVTEPRPLLVVPDSRGVVRSWIHALAQPWYRDIVVLVTRSTPRRLPALPRPPRHRARSRPAATASTWPQPSTASRPRTACATVRTDGGGALNGALLAAGLVDEIAILLDPVVSSDPVGQRLVTLPHPAEPGGIRLRLEDVERFDDGALLLRYATDAHSGMP